MKAQLLPLASVLLVFQLAGCGKKAEIKDTDNKSSIHTSKGDVHFPLTEVINALNRNDLPALKIALQNNPDIDLNQIQHEGETFLILAIRNGSSEIRNYLLEKGASPEKADINKQTPLMAAAIKGDLNSIEVLLDLKVDLEKKDNRGDTALHLAIKNSHDQAALLLVKSGANTEALDSTAKKALHLAEQYALPECIKYIKSIENLEEGAPDLAAYRDILLKADHGRLSTVLEKYPFVAVQSPYEDINPLALLADAPKEFEARKSAELLIKNKSNVNGPVGAAETPLIKATMTQKKSLATLYLLKNANTQLQDKDGKSALIHAVELNNPDLVDLLISYSAPEKYTFRRGEKKITYNACKIAGETGKKLKTALEKENNKKIKKRLDCGFFRWPF